MATNRFMLGGVPPTKWITKRKAVQFCVLGGSAIVLLVLVARLQSPLLLLAFGVAAVLLAMAVMRRNEEGQLEIFSVGDRFRSRLAVWGRWDDFDPATDDVPWLLGPHRVKDLNGFGLVEEPGAYVFVVEVVGGGEGIRRDAETVRRDRDFSRLLRACSRPTTCVDQLDFVTLVRPESRERVRSVLHPPAPRVPGHLRSSMLEVADRIADESETTRSWAVIRLSIDRLMDYVARPPFTADSAPAAGMLGLSRVIGLMNDAGLRTVRVLDADQLAALSRAVLCPDYGPDDVTGLADGFWASMPAWQRSRDGSAVRVEGPNGPWWLSTGGFGRQDWPVESVPSRWMEPLVFGRSGSGAISGPRIIVAKYRLLTPARSHAIASSQKTTASSHLYRQQHTGDVNQDEAEESLQIATRTRRDVVRSAAAGVVPQVRVLITGRDEFDLRLRREQMDAVIADMSAAGFTWDKARPGPGILDALPIGKEVVLR